MAATRAHGVSLRASWPTPTTQKMFAKKYASSRSRRVTPAIAAVLLGIACGGSTITTPPAAPVASVAVTPTAILLSVGQSRALTAITKDAQGHVLTGREVTWSVDGPNVSVSSNGVILGVSHGYATVIASSEGKTFGVGVTVSDPE
jgi:uncharacterized protein YjdB